MLVLSRKKNEIIRIGDDITIMVVEIRGETVRLGISAPRHISIHRQEVYEVVQALPVAEAACDVECGPAGRGGESEKGGGGEGKSPTPPFSPSRDAHSRERRGLAGADADQDRYQAPDDQPLLDKMRDEEEGG